MKDRILYLKVSLYCITQIMLQRSVVKSQLTEVCKELRTEKNVVKSQ